MEIKRKKVGNYGAENVYEYTLTNSKKLSLSVLSYGAIITKIKMPDKEGKIENITTNVNSLDEIIKTRPFHGAIIGPVAGRISNGEYLDGDQKIKLTQNESLNTLHSGNEGLDTKNWETTFDKQPNDIRLILKTILPDGEEGFPGDISVTVTYVLTEDNEIKINYEATSNKKTLFNPTNHVYFNLSGNNKEKIYNHQMQIQSNYFSVLDSNNIPTGELKAVKGTSFDLRDGILIEEILNSQDDQIIDREGLDHPFILNNDVSEFVAKIKHEKSGRMVEMKTNCDAVVVYTHNHEHIPEIENEPTIPQHSGVTLETSKLPDAVNQKDFGSIWLQPREVFNASTTFRFSLLE